MVDFQIIDWYAQDEFIRAGGSDEEENEKTHKGYDEDYVKTRKKSCMEYVVYIFGKMEDGKTISVRVKNFTPFFWIELPKGLWNMSKARKQMFKSILQRMTPFDGDLVNCIFRDKYRFRDYQWNTPRCCAQLQFRSSSAMRKFYYKFQELITIPGFVNEYKFRCYEKKIDPVLRLIHIQGIKPIGCLSISEFKKIKPISRCDRSIETSWKNVLPGESTTIGKLRIASFDIEADSSHGDFPLAKKDYHKLSQNIIEMVSLTENTTPMHISLWLRAAFREYDTNIPRYAELVLHTIQTIELKNPKKLDFDVFDDLGIRCWGVMRDGPELLRVLNKSLPAVRGDKVIQIGTVFSDYGTDYIHRTIVTLGSCDPIPGCEVIACDTVYEVFQEWVTLVHKHQPSIITGYNIFGFDFKFMWECAEEYGCVHLLEEVGLLKSKKCVLKHEELNSSALGQNHLYYFDVPGIVLIDLMKVIQRDHNLSSYKLDNVSVDFINGTLTNIEKVGEDRLRLDTKSTFSLKKGDYIIIQKTSIIGKEGLGPGKFKIMDMSLNEWIEIESSDDISELVGKDLKKQYLWAVGKDDVSPNDIFRLQRGNSADRCTVAKYCVQDCELCIHLLKKLEIVANNVGMGNVCLVPMSYLFMRGQMIKTLSLVASECRKDDYLIPDLPKPNMDIKESYEGAEVLEPKPAIYLDDDPISVLDYGSLYPSSMIGNNISHDTIIRDEEYLGDEGAEKLRDMEIEYVDITYDNYITVRKGKVWVKKVHPTEKTVTCRYIQPPRDVKGDIIDEKRGILPRILMKLLSARKATRKEIATEKDIFRISVLDGLQLAYKVTANSLYGGVGAGVSALYYKDIAASTTATGREHLHMAKDYVKKIYPEAEVIYGDTDSIFVNFHPTDNGKRLSGKDALKRSIEMSDTIEKGIQPMLKYPHKLEYEKTFMPFILFSKKRYIGNKYEFDINSFKQSSMGVVTKRRDNAPIVKYTYDGIISRIINKKDIEASIDFLKDTLGQILNGEFGMQYFVITKNLRSDYKNPKQVVHKVLADRMAVRDPGNKPQSNDRIPYAYIYNKKFNNKTLQGDRVEHPNYIKENNLRLDYLFYVTNQVMNPVCQIYALALEHLDNYKLSKRHWEKMETELKTKYSQSEVRERIMKKKTDEAQRLLFQPIIDKEMNRLDKIERSNAMQTFFAPRKSTK